MNRLIIFTGAGISAESGLNTFRDTGGIWEKYDLNEVCNIITFRNAKEDLQKREKIFSFYNLLKPEIKKAQPNVAHEYIAKWQKEFGKERVKLITTNIDDLQEKAGCQDVLHVHGDCNKMNCVACSHEWFIGEELFDYEARCPQCNSRLAKPGVIFFNEIAPLYHDMHQILKPKPDDIVLVIGSSLQVINSFTILPYTRYERQSVLINKHSTLEDNRFNKVLLGNATNLVPYLEPFIYENMQ